MPDPDRLREIRDLIVDSNARNLVCFEKLTSAYERLVEVREQDFSRIERLLHEVLRRTPSERFERLLEELVRRTPGEREKKNANEKLIRWIVVTIIGALVAVLTILATGIVDLKGSAGSRPKDHIEAPR